MRPFFWFWAKLGTETWPDRYHPVICHLIDVAAVTWELWHKAFRPTLRSWLAERLGLDEDACACWLAFVCGAHDIGKVALCFQDRNDLRTARLRSSLQVSDHAFILPTWDKPHGTISSAILADLLAAPVAWPSLPRQLAEQIAVAVGGHHGLFPADWVEVLDLLRSARRTCPWDSARKEILGTLARLCRVETIAPKLVTPDDQSVFMVLAGLTSVADWIGSNQEFFKPVGCPAVADGGLDLETYYQNALVQAQQALRTLGWLERAAPIGLRTFKELFAGIVTGTPRPLQNAAVELAQAMTKPSLVLIEAPMGEGKTEAAWYVADAWDQRGGQGSYVALPTMATSNQMFDRVGTFLQVLAGKKNLMLMHGKAALNEQFEKLKYAAWIYDEERHPSALVAEDWFAANKKHGFLAPYGVGTIDQALLAVLQTKHMFVRLFGLAGKCVILDEVHAYDAYMTTLMECLLRWLAFLGCPVVLLSATLPRNRRMHLLRAYAGDDMAEPLHEPYPRITSVSAGSAPAVRHIEADPARARTIKIDWVDEIGLVEKLRNAIAGGGCVAVIRNTVRLAQDSYLVLRDALKTDGITVELFHARFPFRRRMDIEDAVLKRFGKTGEPVERDRRVLVATQVVEQSLDLDFDLMVSDVAPADLILQRVGRLHRHTRGARPDKVNLPRVWLIEPESKDDLPDFGTSEWVYARFVLLRSYLVFKAVEAVLLPDDLERFVEQVYGTEPLSIPDGWQTELDECERQLQDERDKQHLNAQDVAIKPPDQSPLEQQNQQLEEDDPEAARKIQAQTRDGDPSVALVVVYHIAGHDYLDPNALEPFNETDEPDMKRVRRLLDNEVTISQRKCFEFYVRRRVPGAWRARSILRQHRVLRVDGQGKSMPGEFHLRVDHELGVSFAED